MKIELNMAYPVGVISALQKVSADPRLNWQELNVMKTLIDAIVKAVGEEDDEAEMKPMNFTFPPTSAHGSADLSVYGVSPAELRSAATVLTKLGIVKGLMQPELDSHHAAGLRGIADLIEKERAL